jgi:hypothetical protein
MVVRGGGLEWCEMIVGGGGNCYSALLVCGGVGEM